MFLLVFGFSIFGALVAYNAISAQGRLQKSWVKTSLQDFRETATEPDTTYLRYEFRDNTMFYGFEPKTYSFEMPYAHQGNLLKLAMDQWTIETLTDTTLTIFLSGFKRIEFYAEDYLQTKKKYLVPMGEYKGKPLYKANQIITPRYERLNTLYGDLSKQDRASDYNIHKAGIFQITFIVTEDGKIAEPKVTQSVAPGFDAAVVEQLLKSARHWKPAKFRGHAIQTQAVFEIKFMDSYDPYEHQK